jgi:hypothetical protein
LWFDGDQMPKDIAENVSADEQEIGEDDGDDYALGNSISDESDYECDAETN